MNAQQQRAALENALNSFGLTNLTTIKYRGIFFINTQKIFFFAWFCFAYHPGEIYFFGSDGAHFSKLFINSIYQLYKTTKR